MEARQKAEVYVRIGEIVLNPVGEEEYQPKIKMIENILRIIVKDTTVDRISRIVRLNMVIQH